MKTKLTLLCLALALVGAVPASAQYVEHPQEASGLPPSHGYFGVLPWEQIDMMSGNVVLTFPVLDLPGNNGLNLKVVATFNSKSGWRVGYGPRLMVPTMTATSSVPYPAYPFILTPDGSRTPTFATGSPYECPPPEGETCGSQFMTTTYWLVDRDQRTASLPSGIVYQFDAEGRMTEERDPYNNTITASYDGNTTTLVQDLGAGQQRTVTITSGDGAIEVAYLGRTWTWTWGQGSELWTRTYQPPEGAPWQIVDTPGGDLGELDGSGCYTGLLRTLTVTTPGGGEVAYDFKRCYQRTKVSPGGFETPVYTSRIASRRAGARGITPAEWTFSFSSDGFTSAVQTPDRRIEFRHATYGQSSTALTMRDVYGPNLLERRTWAWWDHTYNPVSGPIVVGNLHMHPDMVDDLIRADPYPLLPQSSTVARDGHTWTTTYSYSDTNFNDYGQANLITDGGDFDRSVSRTFWDSPSHYIRGHVSGETVQGAGQSFTWSKAFNPQGFRTSATDLGVTTTFSPDSSGNVASQTDANGHETTFLYSWGVVSSIAAPEHTTSRAINPDGTVAWESRGGFTRVFTFDTLGRETRRSLRNGGSSGAAMNNDAVTTYDPGGGWMRVERGSSRIDTTLDGYGRPTGTTNAVGVATRIEYDSAGRRVYEGRPFDGTTPDRGTVITYDRLDRVTRRENADGTATVLDYFFGTDGRQRVAIIDEEGHARTEVWEASGQPDQKRLASVIDAGGNVTSYTYDVLGSLTGVTHPDGSVRSWAYDGRHWLASETHPESGTVSYGYAGDNVGNVRTRTDASGRPLQYSYDGENRLTGVQTPDSRYNTWFAYDGWGNRYVAENAYVSLVRTFEADLLKQTVDFVRPSGDGAWNSSTTDYEYDGNDNLLSIRYPAGARRSIRYQYDAENRIQNISEDGGPTYASGFVYHPSGAIQQFVSGNGVVNTVDFNDGHQRDWPSHVAVGNALSLDYGYDNVGNVRSITGAPSGTQSFTYDALDRLYTATGPWQSHEYQYDSVGNWTSKTTSSGTTTFSAPGNRLTGTGGPEARSITYDGGGRVTSDALASFTYTPFDMVETTTTNAGLAVTYRYDADQRRTVKTVSGVHHYSLHGPGNTVLTEVQEEAGAQTWTRDYIYAGSRLIASVRRDTEATLTVETTGRGSGRVTSAVPAGAIDCSTNIGPDCSERLQIGQAVTLVAVAATGAVFDHWACDGTTTTAATMTTTLSGNTTCRAFFAAPRVLTVSLTGAGSGSVASSPAGIACASGACSAPFDLGTAVTLTATPAPGSLFRGWTGDCAGTVSSAAVTMDGARSCGAVFARAYRLTLTKVGDDAAGTRVQSVPVGIDCTSAVLCQALFEENAAITWVVSPPSAATPVWWSGDCGADGTVAMAGDRACTLTLNGEFPKQAPASGVSGLGTSVTLSWGQAGNSTYEVCWDSTDNDRCDSGNWVSTGQARSKALDGLTAGVTYYWQVRTQGASPKEADNGAWSGFTVGAAAARTRWLLAEGTTAFTEDLTLSNPTPSPTQVTVQYLRASDVPVVRTYNVPAHARQTVRVNSEGVSGDVAIVAESSSQDIVLERSMSWWGTRRGGHMGTAVQAAANDWYFAEGYTSTDFTNYVLVSNPGTTAADVTITYYQTVGGAVTQTVTVPPLRRWGTWVNGILGNGKQYWASVHAEGGAVVAERSFYWGNNWEGGHNTVGTSLPATRWYFAEGTTMENVTFGNFGTYFLVANPDPTRTANVRWRFLLEDARVIEHRATIAPRGVLPLYVGDVPGMTNLLGFAAIVDSLNGVPIVAERSVYWNSFIEGHNTVGSRTVSVRWDFAEGREGTYDDQPTVSYFPVLNPSATDTLGLHATFYRDDGTVVTRDYVVAPGRRFTIGTGAIPELLGTRFSATFEGTVSGSTTPLAFVVEHSMYWGTTWYGGSGSMGVPRR